MLAVSDESINYASINHVQNSTENLNASLHVSTKKGCLEAADMSPSGTYHDFGARQPTHIHRKPVGNPLIFDDAISDINKHR